MRGNNMSWIAVDRNGREYIHEFKPLKFSTCYEYGGALVCVPKGTAEKLTGSPMSWADEPREVIEDE